MTAQQGPLVRDESGEVTVDGVVIGKVHRVRPAGAARPLWGFSRMVLNRGVYAPGRGVYQSRAHAVRQLMDQANQTTATPGEVLHPRP